MMEDGMKNNENKKNEENMVNKEHMVNKECGERMTELRVLDAGQVKEIYDTYMTTDFPKSELPPVEAFFERLERGIYECLGLYEDGALRAYGYFTRNDERGYMLLDFLAVCPEYRSGGYGSKFLQMVKEYFPERNGILLECESLRTAPDEEQREIRSRRIKFYLRNGCRETNVSSCLFGVDFDILYLPLKEEEPQVDVELCGIYRLMFGEERFRKYAKVSLR